MGINATLNKAITGGTGMWADTNVPTPPGAYSYNAALLATADGSQAIQAFNNSPSNPTMTLFNYDLGGTISDSTPVLHAAGRDGDCLMTSKGDSICTGVHKAAVSVEGGARQVEMYAVHAAENWFEDFGSGQLEHGAALIKIDPAFAETVNGQMEYHVFLTPEDNCEGLYVTHKTATSFEVHELRGGNASVAFDYRITARRAGHEIERMADVTRQMRRDPRMVEAMENAKAAASEPVE
jgi:hypothetical protein